MVRCKHCGAENYAIDMWCSNCSQHLDWKGASAATSPESGPAASAPEVAPGPVAAAPVAAPEPTPEPRPVAPAVPVAAAATVAPATPTEPAAPARSRRKAPVWIFPLAAAAVVAVLLAMPVLGWFRAAGQPSTAQLPITGLHSASATSSPLATPSPTPEVSPSPTDQAAAQPAVQPAQPPPPAAQQPGQAQAPAPAAQQPPAQSGAADPRSSVATFYQAVAAHQFDAAAATWSAQMRSAYPPPQYINQRFAYTQQMNLRQAQVVANNGQTATVYIDLIEIYAGSTRHWVGTWQLIHTSSGWLLNQPNLRAAS